MKAETEVKNQLTYLQNFLKYMSKSPDFKQQIFNSFTRIDLQKIVCNFTHSQEKIRKLSLKFICFLLHSNHKNKVDFCKLMDISPSNGRIVLNSFPKSLLARTQVSELLKKLNSPIDVQEDTFCLIYDLTKEKLVQVKKDSYSEFDFVDPMDTLVLIDSTRSIKMISQDDKHTHYLIRNH